MSRTPQFSGDAHALDAAPTAKLFKGIDVAFLRSDLRDRDAFFIGFKGGDNKANHSHLDLGTFVMDALGERWAIDLGGDEYNMPGYFGKQRWSYATGSSVISSPTVANGKVYLGSGDHAVYELDAQTGALSHTYTTSGKVFAQPTVHDDVLYVCDLQGYVYAFGLK